MAREKKSEPQAGAPMWMITYGDLMSLLLTFFVLLLSFASMDKPREVQEAIISIKGAFGVMRSELTLVRINPAPVRMRRPNKEVEAVARRVQRGLQVIGRQKDVKLTYDAAGGLKLTLPSQVLYEPGQTQLRPEAYPVLSSLGAMLADLPETFFEIRGHTDNTPLPGARNYRDNHDLSFARADAVARFLNQNAGIPMDQFEIIGCGAGQPIVTNTSPEGRQTNRRVDIYLRGLMGARQASELQTRIDELTNQP